MHGQSNDNYSINNLYGKCNNFSEEDIKRILQLVKNIQYGAITLVIQDGVIIQIDINEKIRLK